MKAEIITAYKVITNSDLTEGRGHSVVAGVYFTEVEAHTAARGAGVMGTDAEVRETSAIRLEDGRAWELGREILSEKELVERARASALRKLTSYERKILGL